MTWRTVVITTSCKLTYKNNYLLIRNDEINMIHLSEINTLIIDSTAVTLTSYLITELLSRKIKIMFCDHKRNPAGEVVPYYGSHDCSKKIRLQIKWNYEYAKVIWTEIIKHKILYQAKLLEYYDIDTYSLLYQYINEIVLFDETNREGHAAKVYFNSLFGNNFIRDIKNDINIALNYGYSILLSQFNKEIAGNGYMTQLGIKHSNYFNPFNLTSDLMEPFRPLVDRIVRDNIDAEFDGDMKLKLLDILNVKVNIKGKSQYLSNAINIYVKSVIKAIEQEDVNLLEFYEYEL